MRATLGVVRLAVVAALSMAGCTSGPAARAAPDYEAQSRQADAALRQAKTEADALRADVANARIAAAKQEAELRNLRRRVQDLQDILDARHSELARVQRERDRLESEATVAHVRVAEPAPPTAGDDINAVKVKLHELEATVAALATELARVRKELAPAPVAEPVR